VNTRKYITEICEILYKMGGSTAFGYEQENGSIHYCLTNEDVLDMFMEDIYARRTPCSAAKHYIIKSLDEYFSEETFIKDDSVWRILYMLDGKTLCKRNDMVGELLYRV